MRLIRIILLSLVLSAGVGLFEPIKLNAQDVTEGIPATGFGSDKNFRWGFKAGTTLNQFNAAGMTMGFNGGLLIKSYISGVFDFQAELLYMMQGSGREDYTRQLSDIGGNVAAIRYMNRAVSLQSAEIPVLLAIKLGSVEGAIKPKLLLGVSYGFCFNALEIHDKHYFFTDGTEGIAGREYESVLSDFEQHQFDGIGGFGIDFNLNNSKLFILDVRYNYGLNDINLFKSPYTGGAIYQNTLSINCSYMF